MSLFEEFQRLGLMFVDEQFVRRACRARRRRVVSLGRDCRFARLMLRPVQRAVQRTLQGRPRR